MSYIGIPPFGQTIRTLTNITATASQTTFNITGGYIVGYVDVYLNGVLLTPSDYTATDGLTVVLGTGATASDEFQAISYQPVSLTNVLPSTGGTVSGNVTITGTLSLTTDLAVADGGTGASSFTANNVLLGNGTSAFQVVAPGTNGNILTSNGTTWTSAAAPDGLPSQTGNSGKYLTTDGSTASWAVVSSNTTSEGLYENANTISANYTISSGNNALSAGPITINSGITVTVPTGSTWTIV